MSCLTSTLPVVGSGNVPIKTGHFPTAYPKNSLQTFTTKSSWGESFPFSENQKLFTATVCPEKKVFPLKTSYKNEANLQVLDGPVQVFEDIFLTATKIPVSSATTSSGVVSSSQTPIKIPCSSPSSLRSSDAVSAVVSSSLSQSLSPNAKNWIPTANTKVINLDLLYPPGKNPEGIEYKISDEAWVALELGEKSSQDFDLPGDAKPDLDNEIKLFDNKFALPNGSFFVDKILPPSSIITREDKVFPAAFFIDLHKKVRESGTYNFAGARLELPHSKLNVVLFRHYLEDYGDREICQFLQFGFPLGLAEEVFLEPALKNHRSSYSFYSYIDKFIDKEVSSHGLSGPLSQPPFNPTMLSPMMTSPKNIASRRPVFDASYGDWSLNENTPVKSYMGGDYDFTFPTVLDLADLIVKKGSGCLIWKRDLKRWFLQLPVDPADYDKLGFIWRGKFWWFVSFVWGCRHAGYNGQRVSSAILFIFKKFGVTKEQLEEFCAVVYMDDFAGCEIGERASVAYETLGNLLVKLGVQESEDKAHPPSTIMKFLGVEFNTITMSMRIDIEKLKEITTLSKIWARKTVATKQELQSILGKLMWVSKVVRFSRCFVARIISILKGLRSQKQKITLSQETRKDFLWWSEFLPVFNGIELLVPSTVFCSVLGDATLHGGGSWNEKELEFFSRQFPPHLKSQNVYIHIKEFLIAIIAQKCLREMMFYACKFHFQPVFLRITTGDNDIADFISRNYDYNEIMAMFSRRGLHNMKQITVADDLFNFVADW